MSPTSSMSFSYDFRGQNYLVDVDVEYYHDPMYGADADGRRGIAVTFVESFDITGTDPDLDEKGMEELAEEIDLDFVSEHFQEPVREHYHAHNED